MTRSTLRPNTTRLYGLRSATLTGGFNSSVARSGFERIGRTRSPVKATSESMSNLSLRANERRKNVLSQNGVPSISKIRIRSEITFK